MPGAGESRESVSPMNPRGHGVGGGRRGSPPQKRRREVCGGGASSPPLTAAVASRLSAIGCRNLPSATSHVTPTEQYSPRATTPKDLLPDYKLEFVNILNDTLFTKRCVGIPDGGPIKIRVAPRNQQHSNVNIDIGPLLSANVKIEVMHGDFNADDREMWTSEEFDSMIVLPRDRHGAVLTGKLDAKLENGEASLHDVIFVDNSKFTRSAMFRLGVKIIGPLRNQVQEGITKPFTVKEGRGEANKKHDIPKLDDELWRLKKNGKDGVYHKALARSGIVSVKDFLRRYHKSEEALRGILGNKVSDSFWTTIVDHAKKREPGNFLYSHFLEDKDVRLYFSSVGQIVGAKVAGQYNALGDLCAIQKDQVEEWSKNAYRFMTYHRPDYEMYDRQPRPVNCSSLQASIMSPPKSTEPTGKIIHEADQQDISSGDKASDSHSQQNTFKRPRSVEPRFSSSAYENKNVSVSELDQDRHLLHHIYRNQEIIIKQIQNIEKWIGTITRIEVKQEGTNAVEDKGKSTKFRLRFLNDMKSRIYQCDEIKSEDNSAIKVGIFDENNNVINSGPLSNVRINIVALKGEFPYKALESWRAEEFDEHRASSEDGKLDVLSGNCSVQLVDGEVSLSGIQFRERPNKAPNAMFIVGARMDEDQLQGIRVQEAVMMNPVIVQHRSNKSNRKIHPPTLNTEVYDLEKIGKDGECGKRLPKENVLTEQDLLKDRNEDCDDLARVPRMEQRHRDNSFVPDAGSSYTSNVIQQNYYPDCIAGTLYSV